jgi:hypothetical protein
MKVEQLILQYLFLNKSVSLENIGTFYLSVNTVITSDNDDELNIPEGSITFDFNPKIAADEGFINFIVEKTRKIKSLAASDLESYTILGKQFLNIGKPFIIKGLGAVLKNQSDEYIFNQSQFISAKVEISPAVNLEKDISAEKINFSSVKKKKSGKWNIVFFILIILVLCLATLFTVHYFISRSNNEELKRDINLKQTEPAIIDSIPAKVDSSKLSTPDSLKIQSYKIVVRSYNNIEDANRIFNIFKGYPIAKTMIIYSKDSINYHLAIPINSLYKDSTKIKDSIRILFGKSAFIDLN